MTTTQTTTRRRRRFGFQRRISEAEAEIRSTRYPVNSWSVEAFCEQSSRFCRFHVSHETWWNTVSIREISTAGPRQDVILMTTNTPWNSAWKPWISPQLFRTVVRWSNDQVISSISSVLGHVPKKQFNEFMVWQDACRKTACWRSAWQAMWICTMARDVLGEALDEQHGLQHCPADEPWKATASWADGVAFLGGMYGSVLGSAQQILRPSTASGNGGSRFVVLRLCTVLDDARTRRANQLLRAEIEKLTRSNAAWTGCFPRSSLLCMAGLRNCLEAFLKWKISYETHGWRRGDRQTEDFRHPDTLQRRHGEPGGPSTPPVRGLA